MSNESPFFLSKVECPICKTINEFETVKVGAYLENGRDTDFCPLDIKWRYPRYQSYNPLVFFTATCGNCYYTREFTNSYKDWKNDNHFKTYRLKSVKDKHLDQLATADSIIRSLGEHIDKTRRPNESAILKLHLAVFDELLAERFSNLDLGRFYLRIGWLFRDIESGENPNTTLIKGMLLEIDNRHTILKGALQDTLAELERFHNHVNAHFDTEHLPADLKAQIYPYKDKFTTHVKDIADTLRTGNDQVQKLAGFIDEYKAVAMGGDPVEGEASFGRYPSFADFLVAVKANWDGVVINERESLERSVYYYRQAYESGREISPGNQQIQASYLIAELSRRIGDYDLARQYFNSTIKHGQDFIYKNRGDRSRTALARKILELAIEQGKVNMEASKSA